MNPEQNQAPSARRDGLAGFSFRESLIAWLTWSHNVQAEIEPWRIGS